MIMQRQFGAILRYLTKRFLVRNYGRGKGAGD